MSGIADGLEARGRGNLRSHLLLVGRRSKGPYAGSRSSKSGCPLQYPGRKKKPCQTRVEQPHAFWITKSSMNSCLDGCALLTFMHLTATDCKQNVRRITLEAKRLYGRLRRLAAWCRMAKSGLKSAGPQGLWGLKSPSGHQTSELLRAGWRVNWCGFVNESWLGPLYDQHAELAARLAQTTTCILCGSGGCGAGSAPHPSRRSVQDCCRSAAECVSTCPSTEG